MKDSKGEISYRAPLLTALIVFLALAGAFLSYLLPGQAVRIWIMAFIALVGGYCRLPAPKAVSRKKKTPKAIVKDKSETKVEEPTQEETPAVEQPQEASTRSRIGFQTAPHIVEVKNDRGEKVQIEDSLVFGRKFASKREFAHALIRVGRGALNRQKIVEAYFWTYKAKMEGSKHINQTLSYLRDLWVTNGMPDEYDNVRVDFPEESGSFARALLRISCGINIPIEVNKLRNLAKSGHAESIQYFEKLR